MITVNSFKINLLNQISYNSFINSFDLLSLTCACGHSGCLTRHGFYTRYIKSYKEHKNRLSILRVKCACCGHTHAVFPVIIVPYSQVTLDDHIRIINNYSNGKGHERLMTEKILIDENTIRNILARYRTYWHQRLESAEISLKLSLSDISKRCIETFKRQFMQIKCTRNIFFQTPT